MVLQFMITSLVAHLLILWKMKNFLKRQTNITTFISSSLFLLSKTLHFVEQLELFNIFAAHTFSFSHTVKIVLVIQGVHEIMFPFEKATKFFMKEYL